ncbi:hypothetical protein N9954_07215 [Maribacter sp.]|nr:hypothetical protein [Maribacter sp.]
MKNKTKSTNRFHTAIRTQHVFFEDEQVFLKKDTPETFVADTDIVEWFPTNFQWIPVRL